MWDGIHVVAEAPPPGDQSPAAVLAPLYEDDQGEVRVILTKRPDTMPTHPGQIAFPGGRPAATDNGPVDTALREAHEEIGIAPDQVEVLGFLPPIDTVEFKLMVVPVVGGIGGPFEIVPSQREVARVHTPRVADLMQAGRWRQVSWGDRQIWCYDLDGDTIWGATARMVRLIVGLDADWAP